MMNQGAAMNWQSVPGAIQLVPGAIQVKNASSWKIGKV